MKPLILTIIFCFLVTATARAQENFAQTALADLSSRAAVAIEPQAVAENFNAKFAANNLSGLRQQLQPVAGENRLVRLIVDEANAVVFGYELTVEPLAERRFRLTFAPLAADFAPPAFAARKSLAGKRRRPTLLTIPERIENQTLADGDALTLDLLRHAALGIKISDRVRVSASRERLLPAPAVPRDLTVDDVAALTIKNLRLEINDSAPLSLSRAEKTHTGSLLWFYLPPKGFFLISLAPRAGYEFRKIGVAEGREISFQIKGDRYKFTSDDYILPEPGAWFVWVLHDSQFQPPFIEPPSPLTAEKPAQPLENPFGRNGKIAKPKEQSGFDKPNEVAAEGEIIAPISPNARIGAATRIENIFPKN